MHHRQTPVVYGSSKPCYISYHSSAHSDHRISASQPPVGEISAQPFHYRHRLGIFPVWNQKNLFLNLASSGSACLCAFSLSAIFLRAFAALRKIAPAQRVCCRLRTAISCAAILFPSQIFSPADIRLRHHCRPPCSSRQMRSELVPHSRADLHCIRALPQLHEHFYNSGVGNSGIGITRCTSSGAWDAFGRAH